MTLFDNIKNLARKRGMSLSELNDRAGLKTNIIYSWKTKTPSVDKIEAVAKVLGVSVDSLLGKSSSSKPTNKQKVDIADDDVIMTFEGKEIPPEDIELMRRLLRGGKN